MTDPILAKNTLCSAGYWTIVDCRNYFSPSNPFTIIGTEFALAVNAAIGALETVARAIYALVILGVSVVKMFRNPKSTFGPEWAKPALNKLLTSAAATGASLTSLKANLFEQSIDGRQHLQDASEGALNAGRGLLRLGDRAVEMAIYCAKKYIFHISPR